MQGTGDENGQMDEELDSEPHAHGGCRDDPQLETFLEQVGLRKHHKEKLSLGRILQIEKRTIHDDVAKCQADLPWNLLKKLMLVNVTARNENCMSECEPSQNDLDEDEMLNPLDIITALFLCSDGFVQQEMALKMSLCQFPVPLLLPNCDTNKCTLMLWALRDIVKKYRPQSLSQSRGFVEDRIVLSELPLVSFVRLGECSLSKSQILNKLLSPPQQNMEAFVHRDMECGDSPRRISNGLTEITWYLPGGNKNMDVFGEAVAVANLRGDIASFETQFSFLCHTSTAVFIFFDNLDADCNLLTNQNHGAQIFLVGNCRSRNFNQEAINKVENKLNMKNKIILKKKNDADLVKKLRETISNVVEKPERKIRIEQMVGVTKKLGILVDEDSTECKTARTNADAITDEIEDILKYKKEQLPLHGQIWKDLTNLEKEECRLEKRGNQEIYTYKKNLQDEKRKLREEQRCLGISKAMSCFIAAISEKDRFYFLKWMRMNLDSLSQRKLSGLRELYKEKSKSSQNKEEIKDIDRQLSNSSLGTEHFFREMGQIYEASLVLPQTHPSRQQLQHLPKLCAQLLLDGFPLELVDGDASNIPLRWVTDVLSQLNDLVAPKNKIMVVTVLGVQSTGKSTLLNTMFGVQFAVSSGRCTRGAFMLLIRVNEDLQQELKCDFVVIIDTEGLKSPELSQLENSYEHDNELATLVVGLSDVTIINVAMENSTEMKDILQIVVHAFLRMKEVGKKPKCQFVHQNVSDVSAHDKNLRDRKLLLQQLDEMTQAAAKMETKGENKSFTDVMEYNPDTGNCYIPGLWNGNPPMAPVNAGYSEAVYELKKNIIQMLDNTEISSNNISEFTAWMSSLWDAVKHENFIFSFRNSLVAEAYMRLSTDFNKWEWDFKKHMYSWVTTAETRIKNFGTAADQSKSGNITDLLTSLRSEALKELTEQEEKLQKNLTEYFQKKEGHVKLVERHKEDFKTSAKSLRGEMESSVLGQLTAAAQIKQGMVEVDQIKTNYVKELEKRVCGLIKECWDKNVKMTKLELDKKFDEMWKKTEEKLNYSQQKPSDVYNQVFHQLVENLKTKGSHAHKLLTGKSLQDCGLEDFKFSPKRKLMDRFKSWFTPQHIKAVQTLADIIIEDCKQFVSEKVKEKCNYHETHSQEILRRIDEKLKENEDLKTNVDFEVSLKLHVCGHAAREFQRMHEDFIRANDPRARLEENKDRFRKAFKDAFHKQHEEKEEEKRREELSQKKAKQFVNQCLRPAVKDFINNSLSRKIVEEMKGLHQYTTRMFFQHDLLLDLLSKDDFKNYVSYTHSYKNCVKKWISDQILTHLSDDDKMFELEDELIQSCISRIKTAICKAGRKESGDLKTFVEDVCKELGDKLSLSQDALNTVMFLLEADQKHFADRLAEYVEDMSKDLAAACKETNPKKIQTKLDNLKMKPQDELTNSVVGCGQQCPFCVAPCDLTGKDHKEHSTQLHRPDGLGRYRWSSSNKLATDICSTSVVSDTRFRNSKTNHESHPYKRYREIYPDWRIAPDTSLKASDYWKYVMTRFNKDFAGQFDAEPADIPEPWKSITRAQAEESLKKSFY